MKRWAREQLRLIREVWVALLLAMVIGTAAAFWVGENVVERFLPQPCRWTTYVFPPPYVIVNGRAHVFEPQQVQTWRCP